MKKTIINGVDYWPQVERQNYKGHISFFPVIHFYGSSFGGQSFYINEPQPTRSKALTIAKNYIKNLQN